MEERRRDWDSLVEETKERIRRWRAEHPRATFNEIETTVNEEMARVRARIMEDLIHESASREWRGRAKEERPKCLGCGAALQSNGSGERHLVTDYEQVIELERSHGRCPECGATVFPPG